MSDIKVYDLAEFCDMIREQKYDDPQSVVALVNRWLDRKDGVAIYQNVDFGHPELGHVKMVSFGGPMAQLEVLSPLRLPERLPDNLPAGAINWRYQLQGVYRGRTISVAEVA